MTHLDQLHADLESAIQRVQRTQAKPNSFRHREALMRVRDARHALMRATLGAS